MNSDIVNEHIEMLFYELVKVDNDIPHIDEYGIDVYLYNEEFMKAFATFCVQN